MDNRPIAAPPDIAVVYTKPRATPTPPRASRFGEVLSNTVVRSAESAMRALPGSPMMAVAVRGASGAAGSLNVPMTARGGGPEGPLASSARVGPASLPGSELAGGGGVGTGQPIAPGVTGTGDPGPIDGAILQSQDTNLYYLQLQQRMQEQNQWFSTISNVMKSEHDTVKTAIGNIR